MRRISTGIVGREILGRFTAFDNSLRSIENDQDIVLNPNGSGIIRSDAHIQVNDENSVRFADSGSSNYVEIKAPSSLGSNITLTLPDSTTAGNVLTTDGSGNLTFADLTIEVSNQTADTDTYYPLLSTSDSGSISSVDVSNSKLSFQPSSGTLSVDNVDINGGSIDGVDIGSNSAATGTFSSVDINGGNIDGTTIGANSSANGTFSSVDINGGNIDGTTIGANSSANGTFDSLTATSITETSSEILKEDIQPLKNSLDKILELRGVEYTRKETGVREAGLIAEDVAQHIPSLVTFKNDQPYGITYTKLTAYLIECIKILNEKIERNHNG